MAQKCHLLQDDDVDQDDANLINWSVYAETRSALGSNFVRILGYFREDGTKSIADIENAMRAKDPTKLVMPAHTLKGEASQFGATRLSEAAEKIEFDARKCVEHHQTPDELLQLVIELRPMFEETLAALDKETSPVVSRPSGGFGRRSVGAGQNGFGRLAS